MTDDKIAAILARCLEEIESGRATVEECLAQYPEQREELEGLLGTARLVNRISTVSPRPAFRQSAAARLVAALPDTAISVTLIDRIRLLWQYLTQPAQRRFAMKRIAIVAMLTTALLVTTGGGVAYASIQSLPGDNLYGLKIYIEDTRLWLAGDEADVDLLLDFSQERLDEIEALLAEGRDEDVGQAVDRYLDAVAQLMRTRDRISYEDAHNSDAITLRIQTQLENHAETIAQLMVQTQVQSVIQVKLQAAFQAASEAGFGPHDGFGPNDGPNPTDGPGPHDGPGPTDGPGPNESPGPEKTPGPDDTPGPEETPGEGQGPGPHNTPGPKDSPGPP